MLALVASSIISIFLYSKLGFGFALAVLLAAIMSGVIIIRRARRRHDFNRIVGICILMIVGLSAGLLAVYRIEVSARDSIAVLAGEKVSVSGRVHWIYNTANGRQYLLGSLSLKDDEELNGRLLIDEDSFAQGSGLEADPGDKIIAVTTVSLIDGPVNPGAFDGRSYWFGRGVHAYANELEVVSNNAGWAGLYAEAAWAFLSSFRRFTQRAFEAGDEKSLIDAIALSDKSELDPKVNAAFKAGGLSHIMSASGLHVSIVVGAIVWLLSNLGVAPWFRAGAVISLLPVYSKAAGSRPSIIRAVLMGSISALCKALHIRPPGLPGLLMLAAFLQLVASPMSLFDSGFQMSYLAIIGLIAFASAVHKAPDKSGKAGKALDFIKNAAGMSLFINAAMLPVIMGFYGSMSVLSPLANIIAIPAASVALTLALASFALNLLWPALGSFAAIAVRPFLQVILLLARLLSGLDMFILLTGTKQGFFCIVYYSVIIFAFLSYRGIISARMIFKQLALKTGPIIAVFMAVLLLVSVAAKPYLDIRVLSVGQGDSILVTAGRDLSILFDTGPAYKGVSAMEQRILPVLRHLGLNKIDVLVITHGHMDHSSGLTALASDIKIGKVLIPAGDVAALMLVREAMLDPIEVMAGDRVSAGRLTIEFVNPKHRIKQGADLNEESLVAIISYGQHKAILAADAGAGFEAGYDEGRVDFLKVGHHGAATSATAGFLAKALPGASAVSVGKNNYGHPNPSTMSRLEASSTTVMRTDREGMIEVKMRNSAIEISAISQEWSQMPFFRTVATAYGSRISPAHDVK